MHVPCTKYDGPIRSWPTPHTTPIFLPPPKTPTGHTAPNMLYRKMNKACVFQIASHEACSAHLSPRYCLGRPSVLFLVSSLFTRDPFQGLAVHVGNEILCCEVGVGKWASFGARDERRGQIACLVSCDLAQPCHPFSEMPRAIFDLVLCIFICTSSGSHSQCEAVYKEAVYNDCLRFHVENVVGFVLNSNPQASRIQDSIALCVHASRSAQCGLSFGINV